MSTLTSTILADFTTSLATALAVGATTGTLQSATDDDGVALPTGKYYLTLDGSNASKEHIRLTLTGTAMTVIESVSRQGVITSGCVRAHRLGATVTLTDFAHIKVINDLINGTTDLDSSVPLKYDGTATISNLNHLATKAYVDGIAIAGSPDASTTTKGIGKVSVAPVSAATPIFVGDNDGRVPTQAENDAMIGTSGTPSSTNPYVTQNDTTNGAVQTATTIAFVNSNPDTITDSGNGFVTAGFQAGQTITVSGSTSNNNTFTIASVVAGTITLVAGDSLTAESAGATVTIAAATIGKVLRLSPTGVIPAEILNESNVSTDTVTETASGDIAQYDYVYANGSGTVKKVSGLTGINTTSTPSTNSSITASRQVKSFNYSDSKKLFFVSGQRDYSTSVDTTMFVGTVNAAETDVSFSSATTLVTGTYSADLCELSTGVYLLIYQDESGAAANGIKAAVVTFDGTTVSIGSSTTLETTGSQGSLPSCSRLSNTSAILFYIKDSNGYLVAQVVTISGTSISTNSTTDIKASSSAWQAIAVNIGSNKTIVQYKTNGSTDVLAAVVTTSGTTISTVGTEVTIKAHGSDIYTNIIFRVGDDRAITFYRHTSASTAEWNCKILSISGTTITANSETRLPDAGSGNIDGFIPSYISMSDTEYIGLVYNCYQSGSGLRIHLMNLSGNTYSTIESTSTIGIISGSCGTFIKLKPFVYGLYGNNTTFKQIIYLDAPNTNTYVGVSESSVATNTSVDITKSNNVITGFTGLTAGSVYYVDDNGQPWNGTALQTKPYGVALTSTSMLIK